MINVNGLLKAPIAPFSHVYGENGRLSTNNSVSFYQDMAYDDALTFDVGNQKVLANISVTGAIKQLTFYRENHLTEEKPGVWVNKTLAQTDNINFSIMIDGQERTLNENDHDFVIDTIENSIPRIQHHFADIQVTEVPFCPIDGNQRKSMLVVGFWVTNHTHHKISINLPTPKLYQAKYSDQQNVLLATTNAGCFELMPGAQGSTFVALIDPDCNAELVQLESHNWNAMLQTTVDYFTSKFGGIALSNSAMTATCKRAIYQSLLALAMDCHGNIVGSNWGSYPATERIWNKDMYYAALPTVFLDGYLCRKIIRWFTAFGVKPAGTKFQGGPEHSICNSLSAAMLAGMYYKWTGDSDYFANNPDIIDSALSIIDQLENMRPIQTNHLCHSEWVSDAYALGDYHTGSNICLWLAMSGMAGLCQDLGRSTAAERLCQLSKEIHHDIQHLLVVPDGPFGQQWPEGRNLNGQYHSVSILKYRQDIYDQGLAFLDYMLKDEKINLLMHDGEESDTTLAPVYGFVPLNNKIYQHTMRFVGSDSNPTYVQNIRGISWGHESGATFPGFISVLMGHTGNSADFENNFGELVKLADLDGSWWWWPYPRRPRYGQVVRNFGCGKCGWASGMIAAILITEYMGLGMNAGVLTIHPMRNLSQYAWRNACLGDRHFDVVLTRNRVRIHNLDNRPFTVKFAGQRRTVCSLGTVCFERRK